VTTDQSRLRVVGWYRKWLGKSPGYRRQAVGKVKRCFNDPEPGLRY
jgi:hypothetical protein